MSRLSAPARAATILAAAALARPAIAAPYSEANKAWNTNNNQQAGHEAHDYGWRESGRTYFPSPEDWTKHPVYQVIVDRFFDGEPQNNAQHDGFLFDWKSNEGPLNGFDVRDMVTRQGGDWRGLAQKLDYIRGMGCRSLWISPVQQNGLNSPMGYLSMDKTLLERRFGSLADFRHLVSEAHKRDMYIIVDVVNNHMGELLDWVSASEADERMTFRMHHGGELSNPDAPKLGKEPQIRPKHKVLKACEQTPGCNPNTYQPYVDFPFDNTWHEDGKFPGKTYREAGFAGMPLGIEDVNGTGDYWECNFHHSGEMPSSEEGPWNWPLGKLYGTLDDLRTTNDTVVDKLIAASIGLITALDIDGFRLDTPRECAYTSWTQWRKAVDRAARGLGKQNFGTWGELWSTPERAATYMGRGKDIPMYFYEGQEEQKKFINPEEPIFDGLINYNYFYWIVTVFRNAMVDQAYMAFNILEWETTLGYDIEWPSFPLNRTDKVPKYQMWNFCGSHDQHRLTQFVLGAQRLRLCQAWLYTWPGIPVTYQGDEQGLLTPGSGLAYWGREAMFSSVAWSTVPTVTTADGKLKNPADSNNFDQASDQYRFYRRLGNLRDLWWDTSFRCLGDGPDGRGLPQRVSCVSADDGRRLPGVFSYRRSCTKGQWGVVMLMNLDNATHNVRCDGFLTVFPLPTDIWNPLYQAAGTGSAFEYDRVADIRSVALRPFETKALVAEKKAFDLSIEAVSPTHDTAMSLEAWQRQRIDIFFSEPVDPGSAMVEIDGAGVGATSWEEDFRRLVIQPAANASASGQGVRQIRVLSAESADGARSLVTPYAFRVRVGPASNPIISRPTRVDHDIIVMEEDGSVFLEHRALGAKLYRAQHAGDGARWDRAGAWKPVEGSRVRWEHFEPGVPIIVQYYVDGSTAYLVTACRVSATEVCPASYYRKGPGKEVMSFKGDLNQWLEVPAWSFQPPQPETGDHNWTIDVHISIPDSAYLIDVVGDLGHMIGTGNDVTNPFFFPFETFCFEGVTNAAPSGQSFEGCNARLPGPLAGIDRNLCACDMTPQTLFLYDSGMNHTDKWMTERYPEYWKRVDQEGRPVHHGLTQFVQDPSSGLYNLRIPSRICPVHSTCRIIFNDLDMTYVISLAPPGVIGLGAGSLEVSETMCCLFVLIPFLAAMCGSVRKKKRSVVTITTIESAFEQKGSRMSFGKSFGGSGDLTAPSAVYRPKEVLVASLEHIIPLENGVVEKAVAGGLGKVAGLLGQYHPGALVSVHACMPNRNYDFATKEEPVYCVVSGKALIVQVYRYDLEGEPPESGNTSSGASRSTTQGGGSEFGPPSVTYLLLDHPVFRGREEIYPTPQTSKATLEFYALWSQAVARIIDRVRPDIFHCPDFHAAMAVLYLERPVPVVVFLHNAEYQGAVSTQHMGRREAQHFAEIFDLPVELVQSTAFEEGKFSMLKPVVDYVRRHQQGFGMCSVSRNYAAEAGQKHTVFWGLPEIRGIENCMPESERMELPRNSSEEYNARRAEAKRIIQEQYGLERNPNARVFVFVGRWVKQKGVDYIADIAEWMLSKYPDAQLLMIGPVGDPYGTYAKKKMETLKSSGRFSGNLFVHADFLKAPVDLKLACDFCLMPSRDEPFGYVDIEFAWFGAIVVGSLRGGLGKLPGFYFQILNSDSSAHMQRQFQKAIDKAMSCDEELLSRMSAAARRSSFPVSSWQQEVLQVYDKVMRSFDWEEQAVPMPDPVALPTIPSGSLGPFPPYMGPPDMFETPLTPGSRLSTGRQQMNSHRSTQSSRSAGISILDVETEASFAGPEMQRKGEEFLFQEASEAEMQVLVEAKFAGSRPPRSAGAVLEEVEWELQISKEKHRTTKFLGRRVFDVPILDWIIALAYLSGPLVAALPISEVSKTSSMTFYVVDPLAQSLSLLLWTALSRLTPPNLLMASACICRLVLLALPFMQVPPGLSAVAVGLIVPADYVFIYYSFMGNSVGDISRLAVRTGLMLALREYWTWLFLGFQFSSDLQKGLALSGSAIFFSILPALALLRAPRLYWEFRVPVLHLSWLRKLHVLVLFGLAGIAQSLSRVSESALLVMRQTSPFELKDRQTYCMSLGLVGLVPLVLFALALRQLPSYAMSLVKAVACFSMPAVLLQCWAQYEINQAVELTMALDMLIFVSSILGALSTYAVAVAVLATVGSRWRFVSYTCCTGVLSNLARMASFLIFQLHSGIEDPLRSAYLPQTLAWDLFTVALPPCVLAVLLRLAAFVFFDREATGMLQTRHQRRIMRLARKSSAYDTLDDLPEHSKAQLPDASGAAGAAACDGAGREHIVDVLLEDESDDTEFSPSNLSGPSLPATHTDTGRTSSLAESATDFSRRQQKRSHL